MHSLCSRIAFLVVISFLFIGCATTADSAAGSPGGAPPLRVGITPDSPPMIFDRGGNVTGLEADLARRLAKELNRPLEFVDLQWEQLINALLSGKIDIIMSGMTITDARKVRIAFTDHYLKSGLVIATRAGEGARFPSVKSVLDSRPSVGVMVNTTGEAYVRKNFPPSVQVVPERSLQDAAGELKARRIDVFVHDAPAVVWLVSENETDIRGIWEPLNDEYLGWGVRREDKQLLAQVNAILANWKKDGTLREVILQWLPYWKRFD